jgi:hypothetical protein
VSLTLQSMIVFYRSGLVPVHFTEGKVSNEKVTLDVCSIDRNRLSLIPRRTNSACLALFVFGSPCGMLLASAGYLFYLSLAAKHCRTMQPGGQSFRSSLSI